MAISRRHFLALGGAAIVTGGAGASGLAMRLPGAGPTVAGASPMTGPPTTLTAEQLEALWVLGKDASDFRVAGSLYNPNAPAGTEDPAMAGIENIVILMMENHSFDNILGMLGRGDGFTLDARGNPVVTNPYANGDIQKAFHMPTTCQLSSQPTQEWEQAHIQFDNGANDGFVISGSGPVAMGYWTGADLPFEYSLAGTFPIGDRWFCSLLGQTDPNRMYLFAGTSMGLTDDATVEQVEGWPQPPNGTIFNTLTKHGITWKDYTALFPPPGETNPSVIDEYLEGATPLLYALDDLGYYTDEAMNVVLPGYWAALGTPTDPVNDITGTFFADAAAGTLPQVTLIDPNYDVTSQENPQNIVNGEAFLASVVQAVMASPQWNTTLLIINYDEHGGYFDHVPPPVAMAPDDVGPTLLPAQAGESTYNGFMQYGFRVPSLVVSPYAKREHVSRVVHDHTSILATIERKWNLPALTLRDANANDVLDFIDMYALRAQSQKFPASTFATFAAPGNTATALMCSTTGPGIIPPPGSVIPVSSRRRTRSYQRSG